MRKHIVLVLLAVTLSLTGCAEDKAPEAVVGNTEAAVENANEADTTSDSPEVGMTDAIVGTSYSNEGTIAVPYDEDVSMDYDFSIKVPMIMDDSDDARAINDEINAFTKESVETVEDIINGNQDEFMPPTYINISYEAYENGDIVSIVVKGETLYFEWFDYVVVNYDKVNHKRVNNEEIIAATGISEEEFFSRVRGSLGNVLRENLESFIAANDGTDESDAELSEEDISWKYRMVADFSSDLARTISYQNVNKDMMMYLAENNEPSVIALVYVPAGAGQYYNKAKVEDITIEEVAKTYIEYANKYYYDGFEKDCLGIYDLEGYSASVEMKDESGNMSTKDVYMGFLDTDSSIFTVQYADENDARSYTGSLKIKNIDEKGLVFEYELNNLNDKPIESAEDILAGTIRISPFAYFDEVTGDMMEGAIYSYVDGVDLFDSQGNDIEFEKSYG